jgi:hypothetical protein
MWNGFYDLTNLSKQDLILFYNEALSLAKESRVDMKLKTAFTRERCNMQPSEFIDKFLKVESHNTVINRYVKNNCEEWAPVEGEIGSTVITPDWELTTIGTYYLYLILDLSVFNKLIIKWNLKRKLI